MIFITITLAFTLDHFYGEPKRLHPLVGFGWWADKLEESLNRQQDNALSGRLAGALALALAILPILFAALYFRSVLIAPFNLLFDVVILALAIGHNSLREHSINIAMPLLKGDLEAAKKAVAMIVSRDTAELDQNQISKATIESVLENGSDAIFAAVFWYLVAGLPGVILYRLVNTLDAMWGYKTGRYLYFGWFAARFDDVLNVIPARLTALSYALAGNYKSAMQCWQAQAKQWYSINAGPVMAAGAGALQVKLGGDSVYHGQVKSRPLLGCGEQAKADDINRSLDLVLKSIWIWLVAILVFNLILVLV